MSLIAGLCVFGVLTLFKPFNLHEVSQVELFRLALIYALTASVVSAFVVVVLPLFLPFFFNDRHWTVLHEIGSYLFLVVLITLGNSILNVFVHQAGFSFNAFITMLGMVLSVATVPITLGVLVKQKRLSTKFERAALDTDTFLEPVKGKAQFDKTRAAEINPVALTGNNKNEQLEIQSNNLLLITASDNYVEIWFLENGKIQKRLFRNTLKSIQESLTSYPEFYRSHKTHLVNLKNVVGVKGNAQGLKLQVSGLPELVPVSRNLTSDIKEKLKSMQ